MTEVKAADLVGIHEIAHRCGVSGPAVSNWVTRFADFPTPVVELAMGSVWSWPDVRGWAIAHGRLSVRAVVA
jgi:hypothetical protein